MATANEGSIIKSLCVSDQVDVLSTITQTYKLLMAT